MHVTRISFPHHLDLTRTGTHSPPLRPTNISTPEDVARQGRVPVSPSSPRQPVWYLHVQYMHAACVTGFWVKGEIHVPTIKGVQGSILTRKFLMLRGGFWDDNTIERVVFEGLLFLRIGHFCDFQDSKFFLADSYFEQAFTSCLRENRKIHKNINY